MKKAICLMGRVVLIAAGLSAGCGKTITITQYPEFYDPDNPAKNIKSMVVVPFRNRAPGAKANTAGEAMSEELASMLSRSGSYRQVYNRNDLTALMDQQDLQIALSGDASAMTKGLRKRGKVETQLTGAVTAYASNTSKSTQQIPQMAWNPNTKTMYISGYRTVVITRNEGTVTATASLIRLADGRTIHATGPRHGRVESKGATPRASQQQCLRQAANQVVLRLLEEFAVVRKTIKVKGDAFKTASGQFDGKWDHTKKFRLSGKLWVVLRLPDSCDRNRFQIKIARKDRRENLVIQNIRWKKGNSQRGIGYEFDLRKIARLGGGTGDYVAKFYPGPEPKLLAKFKIQGP